MWVKHTLTLPYPITNSHFIETLKYNSKKWKYINTKTVSSDFAKPGELLVSWKNGIHTKNNIHNIMAMVLTTKTTIYMSQKNLIGSKDVYIYETESNI